MLTTPELETIATHLATMLNAEQLANLTRPPFMTIPEAAEYARVKDKTIRRWIDLGHIYAKKTTGKMIIQRESLDDYLLADKY